MLLTFLAKIQAKALYNILYFDLNPKDYLFKLDILLKKKYLFNPKAKLAKLQIDRAKALMIQAELENDPDLSLAALNALDQVYSSASSILAFNRELNFHYILTRIIVNYDLSLFNPSSTSIEHIKDKADWFITAEKLFEGQLGKIPPINKEMHQLIKFAYALRYVACKDVHQANKQIDWLLDEFLTKWMRVRLNALKKLL